MKFLIYCGVIALGTAAVFAAQAAFVMGFGKGGSLLKDPFWWTLIGCFVFMLIFPWLIDLVTPPKPGTAQTCPPSPEASELTPTLQ